MIFLFTMLVTFFSANTHAGYFQSPVNDVKLTQLNIINENGTQSTLEEIVKKTKNLILVPAYFSCNSTCPLLAENLKKSIGKAKLAADADVIFLSFNSKDDFDAMSMFREHHELPQNWILAVSKNESATKDYLNQFGYQFQKTQDGYDHPNSAFIFSKIKKLWTGLLVGTDNTSEDIDKAIGEANFADLNGPGQTLLQYLSKPEYLIAFGFFGVVTPLLIIIFVLFRKTKKMTVEG